MLTSPHLEHIILLMENPLGGPAHVTGTEIRYNIVTKGPVLFCTY